MSSKIAICQFENGFDTNVTNRISTDGLRLATPISMFAVTQRANVATVNLREDVPATGFIVSRLTERRVVSLVPRPGTHVVRRRCERVCCVTHWLRASRSFQRLSFAFVAGQMVFTKLLYIIAVQV